MLTLVFPHLIVGSMSSGEKLDRTAKKDLEQQLHVSLASQDYEQAWLALERLVQSSGIAKYYKVSYRLSSALIRNLNNLWIRSVSRS